MTKQTKNDQGAAYMADINARLARIHDANVKLKSAVILLAEADAAITKAERLEKALAGILNKGAQLGLDADVADMIITKVGGVSSADITKAIGVWGYEALVAVTAAKKIGDDFDREWEAK